VAKIVSEMHQDAKRNLFKPALATVNEVLLHELPNVPCPGLLKPQHLARTANRLRQKLRPAEVDLDFMSDVDHVTDGFFRGEVEVSKDNT